MKFDKKLLEIAAAEYYAVYVERENYTIRIKPENPAESCEGDIVRIFPTAWTMEYRDDEYFENNISLAEYLREQIQGIYDDLENLMPDDMQTAYTENLDYINKIYGRKIQEV